MRIRLLPSATSRAALGLICYCVRWTKRHHFHAHGNGFPNMRHPISTASEHARREHNEFASLLVASLLGATRHKVMRDSRWTLVVCEITNTFRPVSMSTANFKRVGSANASNIAAKSRIAGSDSGADTSGANLPLKSAFVIPFICIHKNT